MVYQVKNLADFDAKVAEAGGKLVVVDFYANWCGPCKQIAPIIEEMTKVYTEVTFLKVDVDENEEIATNYKISCMPTFVFLKDGKVAHEFAGANEGMLRSKIEELK